LLLITAKKNWFQASELLVKYFNQKGIDLFDIMI
jgi:hypothetical protein